MFNPQHPELSTVSLFRSLKAPLSAGEETILDFIESLASSQYVERISQVRDFTRKSMDASTTDEERKVAAGMATHAKSLLPSVSLSGTMRTRRAAGRDFHHNGWLQADFDGKDNPGMDLAETKRRLLTCPHVICAFTSPSGTGVKAIVRVEPDESTHQDSFDSAKTLFAEQFDLRMDPSTRDTVRICFRSYDPNREVATDYSAVTPVPIVAGLAKSKRKGSTTVEPVDKSTLPPISVDEIRSRLKWINPETCPDKFNLRDGVQRPTRDFWLRMIAAVADCEGMRCGPGPDDTISRTRIVRLLQEWAPEMKSDDYRNEVGPFIRLPTIRVGSLFFASNEAYAQLAAADPARFAAMLHSHGNFMDMVTKITGPDEIGSPVLFPTATESVAIRSNPTPADATTPPSTATTAVPAVPAVQTQPPTVTTAPAYASLPPAQPYTLAGALNQLVYNEDKGTFHFPTENGNWVSVGVDRLHSLMTSCGIKYKINADDRKRGMTDATAPGLLIEVNAIRHRSVDVCLRLAGHTAGRMENYGIPILVRSSPNLIHPAASPAPTPLLDAFLRDMFSPPEEPHGSVQLNTFLGWLSSVVKSLYHGPSRWKRGQVLILAGDKNAGKSTLQNDILTPLLGGRPARPARYIHGSTSFNEDVSAGVHMLMEDTDGSGGGSNSNAGSRPAVNAAIKQVVAAAEVSVHGKNKTAVTVPILQRLTISVNEGDACLSTLPDIGADVTDKITVLRCHKAAVPQGGAWVPYMEALRAEFPAFLHYLLEVHVITPDLANSRFGVNAWQHPIVTGVVDRLSPAAQFAEIVHVFMESHPTYSVTGWSGTTAKLISEIGDSIAATPMRMLIRKTSQAGIFLFQIAENPSHSDNIAVERVGVVHNSAEWKIKLLSAAAMAPGSPSNGAAAPYANGNHSTITDFPSRGVVLNFPPTA